MLMRAEEAPQFLRSLRHRGRGTRTEEYLKGPRHMHGTLPASALPPHVQVPGVGLEC